MRHSSELIEIFCGIEDPSMMRRFFAEIFTPAEVDDFVLRWRLMRMLKEGIPQRKIARALGISLCKITRGAKIINNTRSVTSRLLSDRIGDQNGSKQKTG